MDIIKIRQNRTFLLYWAVCIYEWMLDKAAHPYALPILLLICFCESIFFPIPPDVMMLPMMLARPRHSFMIASLATIVSVLGGVVGYLLGFLLYEQIALPLLMVYGYEHFYATFEALFNEYGNWIVFAGGFSPIPYKVITLTSGFAQMNFWAFVGISVLARGGRFFILAFLLNYWGEAMKDFIEKYFALLTLLFCLLLLGGFVVLKYLH